MSDERGNVPENTLAAGILVMLLTLTGAAPAAAQGTRNQGTAAAAPQPAARPQAFYLELLGNGGLYSLNYERQVGDSLLLRLGFGSWRATSFFSDAETSVTTVPITVARMVGRGAHHLEVGGGLTVGHRGRDAFSGASGNFVSLTGLFGYRYHRPGRGFLFRIGATPFYGFGDEDIAYPEKGFMPSAGVSVGYVF